MNNKLNQRFIFLPLPLLNFVYCAFLALSINNSYFLDPDYAYLFNGLNFIRGESYSIVHVDHPGTPLQVLIGLFIFIISTLRGANDLTADVLTYPQLYIKTIIISIAFFYSLVLFFIGKRYFKHQKNRTNGLILQLSFLLLSIVSLAAIKLFSETMLPLGCLLFTLITIEKVWGKMDDLIYAILSGIILGVFITIKITFLPVTIIPLIITVKWRNKAIIILTTVFTFFISVLPVMERLIHFKSFMLKIATHEGTYGSGQEETLNLSRLLQNFWDTLQAEYTFTMIFFLSLIILILAFLKNKFQFLKDKNIRLLFAIFSAFILQLFLVSKHTGFRYMIPALLFSAFALMLVIYHLKLNKFVTYSILIVTFFSAGYHHYKMLDKAIRINHHRHETYSFVNKTLTPSDPLLVISKESWFGSPFKTHSLMFGKSYCYKQGEQYNGILNDLYPDHFFWNHNQQQFTNWQLAVMPEQVLLAHTYMYLYIQTDNPQLYPKAIDAFSKQLKYFHQDSIVTTLVFSNPENDEEIYLIQAKEAVSIFPKFAAKSGFEMRFPGDSTKVVTTHDSILFDEGRRLNEDHVFKGKYSICITPDNPYGISTTIRDVEQNDFIHISVMCKRSSRLHECCIGIKSHAQNEGFLTLGGVSTETVDDWEKIEYSYRFIHTPAEQKIDMFIWNNSNEPMYFDDLKIELF